MIPCPVCGAGDSRVLYPATASRKETTSSGNYTPTYNRARLHGEISRCPACGFRFVSQPLAAEQLSKRYEDMADPSYLEEAPAHRRAGRHVLERLEPCFAPGARLLEIGCGAGFFLEQAGRRGWDVRGIELSRWMVERARERVPGDRVRQGGYDAALFRDMAFDVVAAVDVIEHLADPAAFVRDVAARLRPGGVAYVVSPDIGSLWARVLGEGWWYVQIPHLAYFSRSTIRRLFTAAGFGVEWIGSYPRFVTPEVVRHRVDFLAPRARGVAAALLRPLLARPWTLRLDLGDQLAVLATRR